MKTVLNIKKLNGFEVGLDYFYEKENFNSFKVFDSEGIVHKFDLPKLVRYFILDEQEVEDNE